MFGKAKFATLLALTLIGGCVRLVPETSGPRPVTPPAPPAIKPATAALTGVVRGPLTAGLGFKPENTAAALQAFAKSCPRVTKRTDNTGLTRPEDWAPACAAASTWPEAEAARFFTTYFETAEVGDGAAFVTGYFEPEIAGSRTRQPGFEDRKSVV